MLIKLEIQQEEKVRLGREKNELGFRQLASKCFQVIHSKHGFIEEIWAIYSDVGDTYISEITQKRL